MKPETKTKVLVAIIDHGSVLELRFHDEDVAFVEADSGWEALHDENIAPGDWVDYMVDPDDRILALSLNDDPMEVD